MKNIKKIISKRYIIYHMRWQGSAFVMMPFMMFLQTTLPLWANLMVGQFLGAIIFYGVDKYIFKEDKKHPLEEVADNKISNPSF